MISTSPVVSAHVCSFYQNIASVLEAVCELLRKILNIFSLSRLKSLYELTLNL